MGHSISARRRSFLQHVKNLLGTAEKAHRQPLRRREIEALESRQVMAGDITGTVFNDLNANGIDDPSENGLAGWTVFIDSNADGKLNAGERSTVTDDKGKYAILGVPAGTVNVYEIPQDGFSPTPGFTDHQSVTVRDNKETRVKFGNVTAPVTTGRIVGTVFEDDNENGIKESGEHGLEGWTVFIDANNDGILSPSDPFTVTNTDGEYLFAGIAAGSATVYEIPQGGLAPTIGGLFPTTGASDHRTVTVVAGSSVRSDYSNLLPQIGTIQGTVWNDDNGDGLRNAGELPLAGQTVFIDLNNDGLADASEPTRLTDAEGNYSFVNIHTGSYTVKNVLPGGWISADTKSATVFSTVFRGSVKTIDFANLEPRLGSISGSIWNDLNGDGLRLADESGIAGRQVYVDDNLNGLLDAGEQSALTDAAGGYSFSNQTYGYHSIREIVPSDWIATNPATGGLLVHLLNGENRANVNIGNRERIGTVQGTVWDDTNGDGLRSVGETGLAGQTVFLDANANGILDTAELSAVTNPDGSYLFTRVAVGNYQVVDVLSAGWIAAERTATSKALNLTIGSVSTADFYNVLPVTGTIAGSIWSDADSNGVLDATETGLADWTVYVDLNNNGVLDTGESSAVTDAAGNYLLNAVPYGTHTIREIVQAGFTPTNRIGGFSTFVLNGENRIGVNFGNHETADYTISGSVFHDANVNGVRDAGETGISGVTVYLDLNNNGFQDTAEPVAVSSVDLFYTPGLNETGTYSFTHLTRGTYHVRETVPDILSGTSVAVREQVVTIGPGVHGIADFANNYRANEIQGIVYDDTNANQILDDHEHRRSGVSVYIDLDRDDVYDADEPFTVSADDGSYTFTGLTPGAYVIRERDGYEGRPYNPAHTGGVLWPAGTSNPARGNVDPASITVALNNGETYRQTVSLTLPGAGSISNMVDVFLLFDDTGSFTANSPIVRAAFPAIISSLQASLPGVDLGFGVGRFEEYANFASEFASGRPFTLNQPIISASTPGFSTAIQAALDRTAPGYGGDAPETDIEALYQLVTGRGFDGNNNGTVLDSGVAGLVNTQINPGASGDVPDFASFVADTANGVLAPAGNVGGGGFRSGALPIILLATDTGFAFQPMGETSITGAGGLTLPLSALTQTSRGSTPFSYGAGIQQTITALNALGALVVGLGTNPLATIDPRQDLEAISQLTGAINRSTSTIANGTADAIAPGDPLYFQIGSGFGGTVADGVVNAIQNAATNMAMDITVRASDPRVRITNSTGVLQGVASGQKASFNVEFTGDDRPHRFDLQFIREGTDVVLGSIPVVIGANVVGDGYNYDELEDGEIHHSSHFGNYVANVAPSFVAGTDITVAENAGAQSFADWATDISAGPINEALQAVDFQVSVDNPSLFSTAPTIDALGTLTFTPAANAFGTALVTVLAHDNGGIGLSGADTSSARTFAITITPTESAPIANDDAYSVVSGVTLTQPATGLLANDVDSDGDVLTAVLVDAPAHGVVELQADGAFIYTPAPGYVGRDQFTYTAFDGIFNSNLAAVSIDILPSNHAPVANGDSLATNQDTALTIAVSSLLANDVDVDGDALTMTILTAPTNGTLSLTAEGNYLYTPNAGFSGFDSFDYLVNDGTVDSNATGVQIQVVHVNHAPVATADAFNTAEDVALTSVNVLLNDSDPDGDALQTILVSGPAHGILTFNASGSFVYRPAANYNGPDSFSYKVTDGSLESKVVAVSLNVTAVNDAPVAVGDTLNATEDTTLTITAAALLGNDNDVESDRLSITSLTAPLRGRVFLNADGTISYTPNANFNGTDSFTYRASDGSLTSLPVTVTISVAAVNDAPVSANDSYSLTQDTVLTSPARGVLVNDSDLDGDVLAAILGSGPAHGVLTLNSDGSFRYVPTTGYTGSDSFTYRASDSSLLSALTTVTITVIPAPPATKFFVVDGDTTSTFQYTASGTSLSNAALNKADSKPRGIASNAAGTTQWVIDTSGTIFVYDNKGVTLGQWSALNLGKPEGIAVWGNDVWIVDANSDQVFKFTGGATLRSGKVSATSSFALNTGNLDATDIVTDGTHLWVTNDTLTADKVFRYTTAGVLEGSWSLSSSNPNPTGITLDPANVNHLWVVDASTDRIYQYDGATALLTGAQEASQTFVLTSLNTNPQGIADPLPQLAANSAPQLKTDDPLQRSARQLALASFERREFEPLKFKGSDDSRSRSALPPTFKTRIDDSHHSGTTGTSTTDSTSSHHQPKADSVRDLWESLFAEWESNEHGSHGFKS